MSKKTNFRVFFFFFNVVNTPQSFSAVYVGYLIYLPPPRSNQVATLDQF